MNRIESEALTHERWHICDDYKEGRALVSSDMKADVIKSHDAPTDKIVPVRKKRRSASVEDNAVGQVLRSAYQRTVDEAIPTEMLDLLNKLD